MRTLLLTLTVLVSGLFVNAQITSYDEFKKTSEDIIIYKNKKRDKIDFEKTAIALSSLYPLDKHNGISRAIIYTLPGKSKNEIFLEVNNWFIHYFGTGRSDILLNDKEEGCIIGRGYVDELGTTVGFSNKSEAAAWVVIRADIKDEKMRVIATIQSYEVIKTLGTGLMILGALTGVYADPTPRLVEYVPSECFPYTNEEKGTGSKALTLAHCWIANMFDLLYEAVKTGVTGLENDDF